MKKHKLSQNIGLKLVAVIFAFFLWLIVVNVDDPVISAVFRNIPVTVTNEEVVTNQGKVYRVVDGTQSVSVTVHAKRSVISKISEADITTTADLSQMEVNTFLVPITASIQKYADQYESVDASPKNLQVKIEDVTKNNFPISVSATGTPRDGYVVGEMTPNPQRVTVRGSESVVESIEKAVARIDVSGLSESGVLDAELYLYDSNGNVIDQTSLSNNLGDKGVSVDVQMLSTKDLELDFGVSGEPAEGYIYAGWSSVPETIQVCGTQDVLDELDVIEVPADEIDISGENGKKEVTVDILPYLPEGVQLVDQTANNVIVTVLVEQEGARTIELPVEAIKVNNLSDDLKISFESDQDLELTFTGLQEALEVLDIRNAAAIDLAKYTSPGKYEVPVSIETASGVTLTGNPTVKIVLTEKKDE